MVTNKRKRRTSRRVNRKEITPETVAKRFRESFSAGYGILPFDQQIEGDRAAESLREGLRRFVDDEKFWEDFRVLHLLRKGVKDHTEKMKRG